MKFLSTWNFMVKGLSIFTMRKSISLTKIKGLNAPETASLPLFISTVHFATLNRELLNVTKLSLN